MKFKRIKIIVLAWMSLVPFLHAEMNFGGPILLKGEYDESSMTTEEFSIVAGDDSFLLTCKATKVLFTIPVKKMVLGDAVISLKRHAIAAFFTGRSDDGDPLQTLVTITKEGDSQILNYHGREMSQELGWVVELGAVSDDGSMILAKCARFLPSQNGMSKVNHTWAFLSLKDNKVSVVKNVNLAELDLEWPTQK